MNRCKTGMRMQSILFDREKWTAAKARSWLKSHNAKTPKMDAKGEYLRFRQAPPFHFKKKSFRTKILSDRMGIKAIVACPSERYRGNPMPTIVALNPTKKRRRRRTTKKGVTKMARRRRRQNDPSPRRRRSYRRRNEPNPNPRRRRYRRRRHNPARGYAKSAYSYGRGILGGVNILGAVRETIPMLFGAVVAKVFAKKFATSGGEFENWTWKNYLLAITGGMVAAIGASALLRGRSGLAQKVFEGSLLLVGYKIFTNEIAPANTTLQSWFGGMGQLPEPETTEYGQIWQGDQTDFVKGADGFYRPIDESHRLPELTGFGQVIPATPTMGDEITPAGGNMGQDVDASPDAANISAEFEKAYS